MKIPSSMRSLYKNPFTLLNRYKDTGVKVVGYTCSYVPEELIISAGLQPYRLPNIGANASALTPSFVCPFASATLENILRFESSFSGFVIAHTCDPMWRLYDILRFQKFLEKNCNGKIDHNALLNSIELCNESRTLLKNIYMLNSGSKYAVNASDLFSIVLAGMWMPKSEYNAKIKELNIGDDKISENVRLHLNGTAIYDIDLIKMIEDSGGFIASDDLCTGSRYFWSKVEKSDDPIHSLAYRYLKRIPCPSQGPLKERLEYVNYMIKEFKVQGVITLAGRFCDPILYDSVHLRNMLVKNGIPTMIIDYETPAQEIGRIKTRVEAFIESIGG